MLAKGGSLQKARKCLKNDAERKRDIFQNLLCLPNEAPSTNAAFFRFLSTRSHQENETKPTRGGRSTGETKREETEKVRIASFALSDTAPRTTIFLGRKKKTKRYLTLRILFPTRVSKPSRRQGAEKNPNDNRASPFTNTRFDCFAKKKKKREPRFGPVPSFFSPRKTGKGTGKNLCSKCLATRKKKQAEWRRRRKEKTNKQTWRLWMPNWSRWSR